MFLHDIRLDLIYTPTHFSFSTGQVQTEGSDRIHAIRGAIHLMS